ncbi:uncharacterized protein N0V89_007120 [Didymosphaeria variabile]|uniref:Uncharacterized protein n=1 Tax=Didymosphaeria variabile TaxID=1932322 RepID=A0A9W9CA65_9PLEO|nr:uncharacterized protein N0V89_007120 [Didymosphaeria variabile]KAJ4351777.1 hypothetical protein N0V89_007120 [Didymosphaeria variabile]
MANLQALEILRVEYAAMQNDLAHLDRHFDKVEAGLHRTQSDLHNALQNNVELTHETVSAEVDLSLANMRIHELRNQHDNLEKDNLRLVADAAMAHEQIDELQKAKLQLRNEVLARTGEHEHLIRSGDNLRVTLRLVAEEMDDALEQVSRLEFKQGKKDRDYRFEMNRLSRRVKERDVMIAGLKAQIDEYEWKMKEIERASYESRIENADSRRPLNKERKKRTDSKRPKAKAPTVLAETEKFWSGYWA